MALRSPMDPQPSLEGGNYKPDRHLAAPQVNSYDQSLNPNTGKSQLAPPTQDPAEQKDVGSVDWLSMARNAYNSSESWLQINQRAIWARNFAHYRSEHAPDSPILTDKSKRAAYFFPKTRTLVRSQQAAAAAAYFASSDVVAIDAEDSDNPEQVEAARFMRELVNYRLDTTIPWYLLVLGAVQEASVTGSIASHQSWSYREATVIVESSRDPITGEIVDTYETRVLEDKPVVRLVPIENLRMSPAADWLDPANSSPYLIELIPMFLGDALTKIREGKESKNGEPAWNTVGASTLMSAGNRDNIDTTRKARAGVHRLDPKSNQNEYEEAFRVIWVHRNIVRHNGVDWLYYTVGTQTLLSDPVPLTQVIPWANGQRDYVIGKMEVETDRPYPSGAVELASDMQRGYNEMKNANFQSVRQVLNPRYLFRSGNMVDVRALSRNVAGGLIGVSAPGALSSHVEPLATPSNSGMSYQEEDRLSLLMDDLTGSTTGSTVNSNRNVHETATGMTLMNEAGNAVREMELKTLTETWIEPVLRQLTRLEAMYETDTVALTIAAKKASILQILPSYFSHNLAVSVNVGMGATSPSQRLQKIQTAIATVTQLVPDAAPAINGKEVAKEVFGAAGLDNGNRFFDFDKVEAQKQDPQQDPQLQLAQQQLQAKAEVDKNNFAIAQGKLEIENQKMQLENAKLQANQRELEAKINLLIAQTTTQNVTAVYEATQAAGVVAQNPGIAPVSDEILKSAGFKDYNQAPVVEEAAQGTAFSETGNANTHPGFPPQPVSPTEGAKTGIETPELGQ